MIMPYNGVFKGNCTSDGFLYHGCTLKMVGFPQFNDNNYTILGDSFRVLRPSA